MLELFILQKQTKNRHNYDVDMTKLSEDEESVRTETFELLFSTIRSYPQGINLTAMA
ncbi:MAG: hypothetical protein AB1782_15260 [Cyanobacteriota bacterium]